MAIAQPNNASSHAMAALVGGIDMKHKFAQLAQELVAKLSPMQEVLERHGLTAPQLKMLLRDPQFLSIYKETKARWNGDLNAQERMRAKAQMLAEDSVMDIYEIVVDPMANPGQRIDAHKHLASLGDMLPKKDKDADIGGKVNITINIPVPGEEPVVVNAEVADEGKSPDET